MDCRSGSYSDFLTSIESKEYNDNIIELDSSDNSNKSSWEEDNWGDLNLPLGLNATRYGGKHVSECGLQVDFFDNLGEKRLTDNQLQTTWSSDFKHMEKVINIDSKVDYHDARSFKDENTEDQGNTPNICHCFIEKGVATPQSNPVTPGLFPVMNVKSEDQFMKTDKLPLVPSHISQ